MIMLSLLLCGFMLNGSSLPPAVGVLHWLSYFAQAYEMLVTNEFHGNPAPFFFTAPVDTLPLLRVTGDGVLQQFGYRPSRFLANLGALCVLGALCGAVTYMALLLTHPVARAQLTQVLRGSGLLDLQQGVVALLWLAVPTRFRASGASARGHNHGAVSPDASATQPLLSTTLAHPTPRQQRWIVLAQASARCVQSHIQRSCEATPVWPGIKGAQVCCASRGSNAGTGCRCFILRRSSGPEPRPPSGRVAPPQHL